MEKRGASPETLHAVASKRVEPQQPTSIFALRSARILNDSMAVHAGELKKTSSSNNNA